MAIERGLGVCDQRDLIAEEVEDGKMVIRWIVWGAMFVSEKLGVFAWKVCTVLFLRTKMTGLCWFEFDRHRG